MLESYKASNPNKGGLASRVEGRKLFRSAHNATDTNEKPDLS